MTPALAAVERNIKNAVENKISQVARETRHYE